MKWRDETEHQVDTDPRVETVLYQHDRPDGSLSSMMVGLLLGAGGLCCIVAAAILAGWI